ncbi:MAG: hypothetical protein ACRCT8_01300 [Lacipirellulaceae bacterium]
MSRFLPKGGSRFASRRESSGVLPTAPAEATEVLPGRLDRCALAGAATIAMPLHRLAPRHGLSAGVRVPAGFAPLADDGDAPHSGGPHGPAAAGAAPRRALRERLLHYILDSHRRRALRQQRGFAPSCGEER